MKQRKNIRLAGNFTVEASLLVPMIIFIIVAFIYLIFFLHDRAILTIDCDRAAEAALWDRSFSQQTLSEDLLASETGGITVSEGSGLLSGVGSLLFSMETASADGTLTTEIAVLHSQAWAGSSGLFAAGQARAVRIDYMQDRLKRRFLKSLTEDLKG